MRKVRMFMFMTLDGRAEFPIYPDAPETTAEEDPMWRPRYSEIDTIILGGVAYQKWAEYWPPKEKDPQANQWTKEFSQFANRAEKVVFSKTQTKSLWPETRFVRGTPVDEVRKLQKEAGTDIALGGGPRIAQSLLAEDLVDEMLIQIFPTLLGHGKPLFKAKDEPDKPEDFIPAGTPGRHDFILRESILQRDGTLFLRMDRKDA